MHACGKHNCTAPRKVSLLSILTASTASQSESRSSKPVTSVCLRPAHTSRTWRCTRRTHNRVVALPLAPSVFIDAQKAGRGPLGLLIQAQSTLGQLSLCHVLQTLLHKAWTD